jgi:hypothetical protein
LLGPIARLRGFDHWVNHRWAIGGTFLSLLDSNQRLFYSELNLLKSQLFDQFGHKTSLTYVGGHFLVACLGIPCIRPELIDPDSHSVANGTCKGNDAYLRLNITKSMKLGSYKCKNDGPPSAETLDVRYRTCKWFFAVSTIPSSSLNPDYSSCICSFKLTPSF